MEQAINIGHLIAALFGIAAIVVGAWVSMVVRLAKLQTKVEHVERDLAEEKRENRENNNKVQEQLKGVYKALNDIKVLIEQRTSKK